MFLDGGGLSIIIPTKDRGNIFSKTLQATYVATETINSEIIIINDSKIKPLLIDSIYNDKVRLINNPKSGVASARNLGVKESKYEHLLFLDDDIIISKENIHELISLSSVYKHAAINFNWEYPPDLMKKIERTQFGRYLINIGYTSLKGWNKGLKWDDTKLFEADLIASYFLYINKSDFDLIGGYNESFPHAGAEDYEFAIRLKKAGIKGLCYPLSMVLHNEEDRTEVLPWLERKERSAETRKIAVLLGHERVAINSSAGKIRFIKGIYLSKSMLFLLLKIIPNKKLFDFLYFKTVNILLTSFLYNGYYHKNN